MIALSVVMRPVPKAHTTSLVITKARTYTVQPGDTLFGIAKRFCGSGEYWPALYEDSHDLGPNPNVILVKEEVNLDCHIPVHTLAKTTAHAPPPNEDPLRGLSNLAIERIDEGQDLGGTGPLYPVAPGTIESTAPNGWPGSAYILEKLDKPIEGNDYVYYAEDITPKVSPGEHVTDGTVLGDAYNGGSGMELGWGTSVPGEAAAHGHYVEGEVTAEGESFSKFLLGEHEHKVANSSSVGAGPTVGPSYYSYVESQGYTLNEAQNFLTIARFLMTHGYTRVAAAGVTGAIAGESAGNPESEGDGGGGLIGWTPLPSGYVTGDITRDLITQVNAILSYNEGWHQYIPMLNEAGSPTEAADIYSQYFERPAVLYSDVRSAVANAVYAAI